MVIDFSLLGQLSAGEITALAMAAALAGLVRGFSGFGAAMIFMPTASAILTPAVAAPLMLFLDNILGAPLVVRAVPRADYETVIPIIFGGALMVPFGGYLLSVGDHLAVRWAITAIVFALAALIASGLRYQGTPRASISFGVGLTSGFLGGLSQLAGPPVIAYWMSSTITADVVRANIIVYFAVASLISMTVYWVFGLVGAALLGAFLLGAPLYASAIYLGTKLYGRASETTFRRMALVIIVVSAVYGMPLFDDLRP